MPASATTPYAYLDTSALAKLVVREPETSSLEADLANRDGLITSRLAIAELTRAARRVAGRRLLQQVSDVFESLVVVELTPDIVEHAGRLDPSELRTLDAIHLATALSLGDAVDFISYDARQADAARRAGLTIAHPGSR